MDKPKFVVTSATKSELAPSKGFSRKRPKSAKGLHLRHIFPPNEAKIKQLKPPDAEYIKIPGLQTRHRVVEKWVNQDKEVWLVSSMDDKCMFISNFGDLDDEITSTMETVQNFYPEFSGRINQEKIDGFIQKCRLTLAVILVVTRTPSSSSPVISYACNKSVKAKSKVQNGIKRDCNSETISFRKIDDNYFRLVSWDKTAAFITDHMKDSSKSTHNLVLANKHLPKYLKDRINEITPVIPYYTPAQSNVIYDKLIEEGQQVTRDQVRAYLNKKSEISVTTGKSVSSWDKLKKAKDIICDFKLYELHLFDETVESTRFQGVIGTSKLSRYVITEGEVDETVHVDGTHRITILGYNCYFVFIRCYGTNFLVAFIITYSDTESCLTYFMKKLNKLMDNIFTKRRFYSVTDCAFSEINAMRAGLGLRRHFLDTVHLKKIIVDNYKKRAQKPTTLDIELYDTLLSAVDDTTYNSEMEIDRM